MSNIYSRRVNRCYSKIFVVIFIDVTFFQGAQDHWLETWAGTSLMVFFCGWSNPN